MRFDAAAPDPDDFFSETRMSIGDHIEDLRTHLLRALYGFLIGMVAALAISKYVTAIISAPVETALHEYQQRGVGRRFEEKQAQLAPSKKLFAWEVQIPRQAFFAEMGVPENKQEIIELSQVPAAFVNTLKPVVNLPSDVLTEANRDRYRGHLMILPVQLAHPETVLKEMHEILVPSTLKTFNVMEAMFVYFKVSVITGLVLSSPWVFYHIWAFVAAGLYPHEKKLVNVYLPFSVGLFIVGVVACQFLIMPRAVEALLWFNEFLGFEPDLRLNEWLGFALMLPVVFGVSFQTPIVMSFMNKIGVLSIESMRNKRRMAWFVMAIVAGFITPTVDPLTMLSLWLPMGFLYEFGILLCVYQKNESAFDDEADPSERNELVEV